MADPKKKILVAEDQEDFRKALKSALEAEGFAVTAVENGKVAESVLAIESFDLLITDIRMPLVNGIELTHFVKKTKPIPVIIMTGFAELTEATEARALGAEEFIPKPFKREDLLSAIQRCLKLSPAQGPTQDLDPEFCKINVDDFITGKQIQYTIYLRLTSTRYLKVAHQGEDLAVDRIRAYKQKNINYLYMRKEDFKKYLGLNLELSKIAATTDKITHEKRLNLIKHTGELILQSFNNSEFDSQSFGYAETYLGSVVKLIADNQQMLSILSALQNHTDYLYAHSLGVSFFSIMIAREMKWGSTSNLTKLSLGGLLHDIGKKEIDPKILAKTRLELTSDEVKLIESHPARGVALLHEMEGIPSDVVTITQQHHECCNGEGYPKQLELKQMHPLARVVALANEFCKHIIKNPQMKQISPLAAIERIKKLYPERFDPAALVALSSLVSKSHRQPPGGLT